MTVPKFNTPLRVQFLAHESFKAEISQWLRARIIDNKRWAIPCHLPTHRVQEAAFQPVCKRLWNWQVFAETWNPLTDIGKIPCSCASWLEDHPQLEQVAGHVASGLECFSFQSSWRPLRPAQFLNEKSGFFPSFSEMRQKALDSFARWCWRHSLPLHLLREEFYCFYQGQERQHAFAIRSEQRITAGLLSHLRGRVHTSLVCHNEDRGDSHLMFFCPRIYVQGAQATWADDTMFSQLSGDPTTWQLWVARAVPIHLRNKYTWAFPSIRDGVHHTLRFDELPAGLVFLKRKKLWEKGRKWFTASFVI